MGKKYIMALDQGTTSSRCILFDHEGNICGMAQKELTQIYPQPGWVEQNPREIWSTQLSVLTEALAVTGAMPEDIEGIGITNQRETTIVWNRFTGVPVYNAIVWQCRRTAEQIDRLKEEKFDELIQMCIRDRIRVGAATEAEMKESKLRMEDALAATKAAVEEGIIAGGGSAYIHATKEVAKLAETLEGDEKTGAKVILKALEAPLFYISANAGLEGAVIINKVRESEPGVGFDAAKEEYVNMVDAGILDPVKVTRSA